jgi:hypothetical protein
VILHAEIQKHFTWLKSSGAMARGGKNRRALLAGNVKQLQEIRLNEDFLLKI